MAKENTNGVETLKTEYHDGLMKKTKAQLVEVIHRKDETEVKLRNEVANLNVGCKNRNDKIAKLTNKLILTEEKLKFSKTAEEEAETAFAKCKTDLVMLKTKFDNYRTTHRLLEAALTTVAISEFLVMCCLIIYSN